MFLMILICCYFCEVLLEAEGNGTVHCEGVSSGPLLTSEQQDSCGYIIEALPKASLNLRTKFSGWYFVKFFLGMYQLFHPAFPSKYIFPEGIQLQFSLESNLVLNIILFKLFKLFYIKFSACFSVCPIIIFFDIFVDWLLFFQLFCLLPMSHFTFLSLFLSPHTHTHSHICTHMPYMHAQSSYTHTCRFWGLTF